MKFLCDNCKAKYQIGDDKVAGKTVRMKCRKCGHQIEVRAAVTETSVARPPPRAPSGPPSRPPAKSALATSLSAAKPRVPSASTAPASALAGAFKSNIQDAPASTNEPQASLGDEWYVAINGVPVGPVRLSELRRKAASGAVTEESLCWQEGLEEWRPISTIPELAALVREAAQVGRPSIISTPEPMPAPPPAPRPSLAPRPPAPSSVAPPTPRSLAPATGRSNVVPLRPAASSPPVEDVTVAKVLGPGPGAAAALAPPAPFTPPPPPAALAAPEAVADPFAVPAPPPAPVAVPAPVLAASPAVELPPQRSGGSKIPLWFWLVLLPTTGFGITFAVMMFRQQPAAPPVVIQVPTPQASSAPEPAETEKIELPSTPEPAPSATAAADTKSKPAAVAAKSPAPAKADVPEKKGIDLGTLMPNGGGPNVGPNSSPGAGGGGLDPAGVERVVASHRNGVKRTCWERGGGDQKSSVNITVSANVAPNGSVASTSSSGDDPVVAKCIENQVRTWQFPAPGSSTTVNIPFKFVRQ